MASRIANTADILAFVTAVEAGGFSAAAARLGLSRSAVAKAVGRLEQRLGTRLLARSTRRLALTEDGRRFHGRCATLLDGLDAAEAEVSQRGTTPRGTLRLAAPDAYGRLVILPLVARYLQAHRNIRVEMAVSDRTTGLVEEGLDLAIRIGLPDALPPDLVARVVGRLAHGFYAAPAYVASRGRPTGIGDLAAHDGIPYNTAEHRWRWRVLSRDGTWEALDVGSRLSIDSSEAILRAAVLGLGIAYLPKILAARAVGDGELEEVLGDVPEARLPIVAVFPSRRNLPTKVRAFIDLLAETAPDP